MLKKLLFLLSLTGVVIALNVSSAFAGTTTPPSNIPNCPVPAGTIGILGLTAFAALAFGLIAWKRKRHLATSKSV